MINEKELQKIVRWVGTPESLIIHTIAFIILLCLPLIGVPAYFSMLILTTIVSLEAIYLSIFIQMGVNRHADEQAQTKKVLSNIEETIDDVQETIEEVQETIEEDEDEKSS